MYDRDSGIASEVPIVQCEQLRDGVDVHRSDQASIVHLGAGDGVRKNEAPPFGMDSFVIRQQGERSLNPLGALVSFHGR